MTWRNKAMLLGGILGALSGLGAALLYIRSVEDAGSPEPNKISTGDAIKMTIGIFSLIKQVSGMAG